MKETVRHAAQTLFDQDHDAGLGRAREEVAIEAMRLRRRGHRLRSLLPRRRRCWWPTAPMSSTCGTASRSGASSRRSSPTSSCPRSRRSPPSTLVELEKEGWTVIPTACAAQLTMDRRGIRKLAAEKLKLRDLSLSLCRQPRRAEAPAPRQWASLLHQAHDVVVGPRPERGAQAFRHRQELEDTRWKARARPPVW